MIYIYIYHIANFKIILLLIFFKPFNFRQSDTALLDASPNPPKKKIVQSFHEHWDIFPYNILYFNGPHLKGSFLISCIERKQNTESNCKSCYHLLSHLWWKFQMLLSRPFIFCLLISFSRSKCLGELNPASYNQEYGK